MKPTPEKLREKSDPTTEAIKSLETHFESTNQAHELFKSLKSDLEELRVSNHNLQIAKSGLKQAHDFAKKQNKELATKHEHLDNKSQALKRAFDQVHAEKFLLDDGHAKLVREKELLDKAHYELTIKSEKQEAEFEAQKQEMKDQITELRMQLKKAEETIEETQSEKKSLAEQLGAKNHIIETARSELELVKCDSSSSWLCGAITPAHSLEALL